MKCELVDELMTWSLEAVLKPNIQELQNIKQKALQAEEQQLVEICNQFERAIQNKQPLEPIFKYLLEINNKDVIKEANKKITHQRSSEDLEI